ncbi:putative TIM9-translocase of the mitochondrial inner membrane [Conidiobolus coronatus NRRL 28638]|uniref:Mitochondrial import inner membrane translocase subunit n=1 Tax=Conidiobolus coronatus (strain ATCC 28846 / CBS 209.66 / NRRL 28638) TaxID=796925 RepID=A0A137PAW6_CONC2|nr:putative TIM9-translocase of the mitochondrial inner membrane [Conidiobolus coronatus NRRL 28638]|eukprot:KXN72168.1 putative TIM9-translocase of the mitochondrial inner membrane [Conidiobolus coronatus NRRL 28638]
MNVDPNTLSHEDQQKFERFMMKIQAQESYTMFSTTVNDCFKDCVSDFTSSDLTKKENKCVESCLTKFMKTNQRISKRFGEENLKLQQAQMNQ